MQHLPTPPTPLPTTKNIKVIKKKKAYKIIKAMYIMMKKFNIGVGINCLFLIAHRTLNV